MKRLLRRQQGGDLCSTWRWTNVFKPYTSVFHKKVKTTAEAISRTAAHLAEVRPAYEDEFPVAAFATRRLTPLAVECRAAAALLRLLLIAGAVPDAFEGCTTVLRPVCGRDNQLAIPVECPVSFHAADGDGGPDAATPPSYEPKAVSRSAAAVSSVAPSSPSAPHPAVSIQPRVNHLLLCTTLDFYLNQDHLPTLPPCYTIPYMACYTTAT